MLGHPAVSLFLLPKILFNLYFGQALHIDMSTILKNESSLFAFMNFLKEKQALDQLHFCLAVEEFNKKIMNPELGEDTMKSLHEDALSLYNLHFKSDAEHKVPVSDNLVQEIKEILDGPMSNVVQLRSTPPLFKAYEEVYSSLESKYCPAFFKSEEVIVQLIPNHKGCPNKFLDEEISF